MRLRASFSISLFVLTGFGLAGAPASAVTIDWVYVGDPGNAPDDASNCHAANCGSVSYAYYISKYEVTNAQYVEFLNAKAASDPLGLYNPDMNGNAQGGITRSGSPGSYTYSVKPGFENKPVNYVSFYDAMRFTNWLNNGQGTADTETGAYTLLGGTTTPSNGTTVLRNPGANIFLPSENEWYKAAYYDGLSATYFNYPAGTDTQTVCAAPTGIANRANCGMAAGGVTDAGAYTGSPSPYGTFDQGGNVVEWDEEIATHLILPGLLRGARAGSWDGFFGALAASGTGIAFPSTESSSVGFRVASLVPEPGTSLLVAIGLSGLAARRGRRKRTP